MALPALRGDRRAQAAGALPQRPLGHRHGLPGGGGLRLKYSNPMCSTTSRSTSPTCRSSSPIRRGRGRTRRSRSPAQAQRLHRPLRLDAEVLPAAARAVREHAAEGRSAVRLRLPADHARPLARATSSRRGSTTRCGR